MSKSREQLNKLMAGIDISGKTVLDVGVQDKPSSRFTVGKPAEYKTLDIDPQWKPDLVADLNNLPESVEAVFAGKFDVIFCIEVLEHCWNPTVVISNLALFLKSGGKLYISTPFINPHHDYIDYLRYTNEWYEKVLPLCGFSDIKITERVATTGKQSLMEFYRLEGLKVSKIRPEYGRYTYPIGYFVEATKE